MHVDRPFRDRQTEPGPATLARAGIIEPEESVENPLSIRSANTRTLIDELDDSLVGSADLEIDFGAAGLAKQPLRFGDNGARKATALISWHQRGQLERRIARPSRDFIS